MVLCGMAVPHKLCAIGQNAAQLLSAGAGLATTAATGLYTYVKHSPFPQSVLAPSVSGAAVGALVYASLYEQTPQARMKKANCCIDRLRRNRVITSEGDDSKQILDLVRDEYITSDEYLIAACHDLSSCLYDAHRAIDLLEAARKDVDESHVLAREAKELIWFAQRAIARIKMVIKIIRDCPGYALQQRRHDEQRVKSEWEYLARERLRVEQEKARVQERIADACTFANKPHVHFNFS